MSKTKEEKAREYADNVFDSYRGDTPMHPDDNKKLCKEDFLAGWDAHESELKEEHQLYKDLEQLKSEVIKSLKKGNDLDEPYLYTGGVSYSKKDIINGIEKGTPQSIDILKGLIMLSADLVSRNKEYLHQKRELAELKEHFKIE